MTKQQILAALTNNFRDYTKRLGHVESGTLLHTIRVVADGDYGFKVVGPDYMIYLDDGEFLNNFFKLNSTIDLLEQYMVINITFELTTKK